MTDTRSRQARRGLVMLLAAGVILLFPGMAWAGTVTVSVGAPSSAAVGSTVEVQAVVIEDGAPLVGAVVALSYQASFGGVDGLVELARAVTDPNGVAALSYQQRAAVNGEMRVDYLGPEEGVVAGAVFTIEVEPGGLQLYRSTSGISIPWLNATVVIGLIALLWSVIAFSALQLVLIGRRGEAVARERVALGARLREEEGSAWIGTALAAAALITATGMVIVFIRSPLTHGNLGDAEGYTLAPLAYVGTDYPYRGVGLQNPDIAESGDPVYDGAVLWVGRSCASCHGIQAGGAQVGPDMSDVESLSDLTGDVRRGPKLMPGFPADTLSDEELVKIHAWLEAGSPRLP